jgi:hypothetical protein
MIYIIYLKDEINIYNKKEESFEKCIKFIEIF